MAYVGEIEVGDRIINSRSYPNLDDMFKYGPMKVVRVEEVDLAYAGNAFVFVEGRKPGKEQGFYICAIEKYQR